MSFVSQKVVRWATLAGAAFLLSLVGSTFFSTDAFAYEWTSKTTIQDGDVVFTGPVDGPNNTERFNPDETCTGYISFPAGTDYRTVTSATFQQQALVEGTCENGAAPTISITGSYADAPAAPGDGEDIEGTVEQQSCRIDGIGWILCPAAGLLARVTDSIYALVEQLLVFDAGDMLDTSNPLYQVWNNVRGLANVIFIVAFFIIIFSQATSIGISAYGIRKLLPRVIASAILVNLSYYLCVFAIDVSNIVGAGLDGLIRSVPIEGLDWDQTGGLNGSGAWTALLLGAAGTGGLLIGYAAAGGLMGVLFAALPLLVVALFAVITALVVLIARHALIIILIILAPLAFVAYILPGTEKWFDTWRKSFIAMMVFYPLVAVVFAGSQVAAKIVQFSVGEGEGAREQMLMVASLAILAFPLFGLPFILKFSGGLLGRIAGGINNPNKGPFDRLRKKAEQTRDTRQNNARANAVASGKGITGRYQRRRADADKMEALSKGNFEEERQRYIASAAQGLTVNKEHYRTGTDANGQATYNEAAYEAAKKNASMSYSRKLGGGDEGAITAVRADAVSTLDKLEKESTANRAILYQKEFGAEDAVKKASQELEIALQDPGRKEDVKALVTLLNGKGPAGSSSIRKVVENLEQQHNGDLSKIYGSEDVRSSFLKAVNAGGHMSNDKSLDVFSYTGGLLRDMDQNGGRTWGTLKQEDVSRLIDKPFDIALRAQQDIPVKDAAGNVVKDATGKVQTRRVNAVSDETVHDILVNPNMRQNLTTDKIESIKNTRRHVWEAAERELAARAAQQSQQNQQAGGGTQNNNSGNTP